MRGQVCELLGNYGPISVMWFDFGSVGSSGSPTLFPLIRQLQPDILINNRCGLPGDFDTPEQTIGAVSDRSAMGVVHDRLAPRPMVLGRVR